MNYPYNSPSDLMPPAPTPPPASEEDADSVRRHFSRLGLSYLIMTVGFMAAAYAVQFAVLLLAPSLYEAWWFSWAVSLLPLYGVGLPLLWICLRKIAAAPKGAPSSSAAPPFGVGSWLTLLVIAFGCMTLGGLAGNLIMSVLSALTGYDYAFALNGMVSDTPVWFTALCTCVVAPFGEELLFRKLLIDRVRRYGDVTSILLSGVLFGLFHGNLFQFFYAALVGMILAYVYTRSGKYLLCVAMHAAINFMGSVVTPALAQRMIPLTEADLVSGAALEDGSLLWAFLAAFLVAVWQYGVLIAGIVLFRRRFSERVLSSGESSLGGRAGHAWLNPGMVACLAVMLALMAVNLIPPR